MVLAVVAVINKNAVRKVVTHRVVALGLIYAATATGVVAIQAILARVVRLAAFLQLDIDINMSLVDAAARAGDNLRKPVVRPDPRVVIGVVGKSGYCQSK